MSATTVTRVMVGVAHRGTVGRKGTARKVTEVVVPKVTEAVVPKVTAAVVPKVTVVVVPKVTVAVGRRGTEVITRGHGREWKGERWAE